MLVFALARCKSAFKSVSARMLLTAVALVVCIFVGRHVDAQTTMFVYQGQLQNSGVAASGSFDFEFLLFDSLTGPNQFGSTLTKSGVAVANGIFSVQLDFGANYPGAGRFLEIHVRPNAGGSFTPLTPRQPVASSPYAVRSLNAASADTVNAGSITGVLGTSQGGTGIGPAFPPADTFLRSNGAGWTVDGIHASDVPSNISVAAGGITGVLGPSQGGTGIGPSFPVANTFLRSNGAGWQAAGISTSDIPAGSANYVQNTTTTQATSNFNVSGTGTANIVNATTQFNIGGNRVLSIPGTDNTFAGVGAGAACTGSCNSNSFFGRFAGNSANGANSSYFGYQSGVGSTGGANSFFGSLAGAQNTTGSSNTMIGFNANPGSTGLNNATAIGSGAVVSQSNALVLGNGVNVGVGISAPTFKLNVVDSSNTGLRVQTNAAGGTVASFGGSGAFQIDAPGIAGGRLNIKENGNVGIGTNTPNAKLQVAGGSVYITNPSSLIITSPNGSCWFITVGDTGALSTFAVACP